jgi:hypothetical protein
MKRMIFLATTLAMLSVATRSEAGQVWFSGVDPVVAADRLAGNKNATANSGANDFMDLFQPNAPWSKAAASIQVFKVTTQFLQRAPDAQLSAMIHDLQRRHIALAFEAEILVATVKCGNGMPGYTTTKVIQKVADRVTQLGGRIDYVAFDEPMAWGHFAHREPTACAYTAEEVVQNMAPNIRVLKAAFPSVVFGDIEPVSDSTPGRLTDILEFARLFQQQTGERLAFLQADLIWQNSWQSQLTGWKQRLHAAGISYGVVIDGDPGDKTDLQWTQHAIERYRTIATNPAVKPDNFIIQSWQPRPTGFLPENKPGTLTSVVLQTVGSLK